MPFGINRYLLIHVFWKRDENGNIPTGRHKWTSVDNLLKEFGPSVFDGHKLSNDMGQLHLNQKFKRKIDLVANAENEEIETLERKAKHHSS